MKYRCINENAPRWDRYGGRGIQVCERWQSFENSSKTWASDPDGMTLERKDVNGHYEPGNCIWADRKAQANNTTANNCYTFQGETKTLAQWAEKFDLKWHTLRNRLVNLAWPIEAALTTPVKL